MRPKYISKCKITHHLLYATKILAKAKNVSTGKQIFFSACCVNFVCTFGCYSHVYTKSCIMFDIPNVFTSNPPAVLDPIFLNMKLEWDKEMLDVFVAKTGFSVLNTHDKMACQNS